MRYGIVADIHSNLEALNAVLSALEKREIDAYLSTGDIVGYGADPVACLDRILELGARVVAGNHDWAAAGRLSLDYFNAYAREAIYWTQDHLSPAHLKFLEELPLKDEVEDITIVHGTLYEPETFDYLLTSYDAHLSFQLLQTKLCLVGHSHVPITFVMDGTVSYLFESEIDLTDVSKAIVNSGSVGQPRDDNPKASFAVYDSDTHVVTIERVDYDIETATSKILHAGLPEILAERLWVGR